ncbi:MAG TPA: hypothetical protein VGD46_07145 [Rhizobacter sp.]
MRTIRHAVALASACLIAACGGGAEPSEPTSSTAQPASVIRSEFVQLEGCVTDRQNRPMATGVHARASDGRLLASGRSNDEGVFTLRVPARVTLQVGLDAPAHEVLELLVGSGNLSLTGCFTASA